MTLVSASPYNNRFVGQVASGASYTIPDGHVMFSVSPGNGGTVTIDDTANGGGTFTTSTPFTEPFKDAKGYKNIKITANGAVADLFYIP